MADRMFVGANEAPSEPPPLDPVELERGAQHRDALLDGGCTFTRCSLGGCCYPSSALCYVNQMARRVARPAGGEAPEAAE